MSNIIIKHYKFRIYPAQLAYKIEYYKYDKNFLQNSYENSVITLLLLIPWCKQIRTKAGSQSLREHHRPAVSPRYSF